MKLCGHPHIDVEWEFNFLNLIVVHISPDVKMPISFVTCCGITVLLSTDLHFSFLRSRFVQTTIFGVLCIMHKDP